MPDPELLQGVADRLVAIGRLARAAVVRADVNDLAQVVRTGGGDRIFAVDEIAAGTILSRIRHECGELSGTVVMEGWDDALEIGDPAGAWRLIVDPLDGSRPWLAGKRSAWVILAAGREARTLEDLEVAVAVEVPPGYHQYSMVVAAVAESPPVAVVEDLRDGQRTEATLNPARTATFKDAFVSVARFAAGNRSRLGDFEDRVLGGLGCLDDSHASSMGQLMEVAQGRELAIIDPRPYFPGGDVTSHPYDLAGFKIARNAGVMVEALPSGPMDYPLDTVTPVAWAAYANGRVADVLRPRVAGALQELATDRPRGE